MGWQKLLQVTDFIGVNPVDDGQPAHRLKSAPITLNSLTNSSHTEDTPLNSALNRVCTIRLSLPSSHFGHLAAGRGNPEVGPKRRSGKLHSIGSPRLDPSQPRSLWLRAYFNAYEVGERKTFWRWEPRW